MFTRNKSNYLFSDIFSSWNISKYHSFTLSNNSLTLGGAVANVGKADGVGGWGLGVETPKQTMFYFKTVFTILWDLKDKMYQHTSKCFMWEPSDYLFIILKNKKFILKKYYWKS